MSVISFWAVCNIASLMLELSVFRMRQKCGETTMRLLMAHGLYIGGFFLGSTLMLFKALA